MSLLSSIFGNGDDKSQKKSRSTSLFDKKAGELLPDRPYHEPAPARPTTKASEKIDENTDDTKKSKKKRKQKAKSEETANAENNKNDEVPSNKKKKRRSTKDSVEDKEGTAKKQKKQKVVEKDDENSSDSSSSSDESESSSSDSESGDEKETGSKNEDGENEQTKEEKEAIQDEDGEDDFVEESATERTIFVGNLPLATTTRKSLAKLFRDCGPISSTRIRSVPVKGVKLPQQRAGDQNLMKKVCANTGQYDETLSATVQGYVVFVNKESVDKALAKNSTIVSWTGTSSGKFRIKVDTAQPTMDASRSVFVGNLPYSSDENTLQDHFVTGCGLGKDDVVSVRVIRDKETFQCKGFGYVLLKERDMVSTALKLHGSTYKNKSIRVMVCGKRFKGRKDLKQKTNKKSVTASSERRQKPEKLSAGALRRILSKQQTEAASSNKRKRGGAGGTPSSSAKAHKASGSSSKSSKRAAADKKADQRLKKIQKRISRGMGKAKKN